MSLWCDNPSSQLCVTCQLAEGALCPISQDTKILSIDPWVSLLLPGLQPDLVP